MKILLLMPLDEKFSYMAMGIYNNLPHEIKDKTFCMPTFMDYLVNVKVCPNYEYAIFDTILSAKKVYDAAKGDDLIIIGNMPKEYKFDAIFNFQDLVEDLPYKDFFLEKVIEKVAGEEILMKMVNNMYAKEDSKLALHNCTATADFLTAYLDTDPHLNKIEKDYKRRLEDLEKGRNRNGGLN